MAARLALVIGGLALAAGMPLLAGEFWMTLLTQIMIFGLLALSADMLLGNAGLFSLCHAAFFAVAAYTTGILHVRYGASTAVAAPAGVLAGTLLAFVFACAVRTRGVYFILITLAFGYIVWGVAYRWASFTGGDNEADEDERKARTHVSAPCRRFRSPGTGAAPPSGRTARNRKIPAAASGHRHRAGRR